MYLQGKSKNMDNQNVLMLICKQRIKYTYQFVLCIFNLKCFDKFWKMQEYKIIKRNLKQVPLVEQEELLPFLNTWVNPRLIVGFILPNI